MVQRAAARASRSNRSEKVGLGDLDGYGAAQACVVSLPHLPHAALPERGEDLVRTKLVTNAERRWHSAILKEAGRMIVDWRASIGFDLLRVQKGARCLETHHHEAEADADPCGHERELECDRRRKH
jgi:hypothetical protein